MVTGEVGFRGNLPVKLYLGADRLRQQTPDRGRTGHIGVVDDNRLWCRVTKTAKIGGDGPQLVRALSQVQQKRIQARRIGFTVIRGAQRDPDWTRGCLILELYVIDISLVANRCHVLRATEFCAIGRSRDDDRWWCYIDGNFRRQRGITDIPGLVDRNKRVGVDAVGQREVIVTRRLQRIGSQVANDDSDRVDQLIAAIQQVTEQIWLIVPRPGHGDVIATVRGTNVIRDQVFRHRRRLVVHRQVDHCLTDIAADVLGFELETKALALGEAGCVEFVEQVGDDRHR